MSQQTFWGILLALLGRRVGIALRLVVIIGPSICLDLKKLFPVFALVPAVPWLGAAAEGPAAAVEHGLPRHAQDLAQLGPLPITNSMVVTWIVAAGLIIFARMATRRMRPVPTGAQNFWEWLVEGLYDFLESIVGNQLARKTFWFFATLFIFILGANWFGLIPGVGSVGWRLEGRPGLTPWLRGANADLNMTLGMALLFFALWLIWALQANGPKGFFLHLFGPKGDMTGAIKLLMILMFFLVGFLEVVSILFRPVSLSFRLFGNIFAGENMLDTMIHKAPGVASWIIPVPFYFMEILVGLAQALVFMLLTAVFTLLICQHEEGHATEHP